MGLEFRELHVQLGDLVLAIAVDAWEAVFVSEESPLVSIESVKICLGERSMEW